MTAIEQVYQAIKDINAKSPIINGIQTDPVPAHTGDIKEITGLELDEIHETLDVLIEQGRVVMRGKPNTSKGRDDYGKILVYPELFVAP